MAKLLDGREAARAVNERTKAEIKRLAEKGITPCLGVVRVGEKPDDAAYESSIKKRCAALGIEARGALLPGGCDTKAAADAVKCFAADAAVHGIIVMRPLPKGIDDDAVRSALPKEKDVDGITDASLAAVFSGRGGFRPCTAEAVIELLDFYNIGVAGKNAVVIGRSLVIGKPAAMLLLKRDATVTVCHTKTANAKELCRSADIVVAAAGRAGLIDGTWLSGTQTVVDVGVNVLQDGTMRGDVDFDSCFDSAAAVSPVPGGVGAVTTAVLMRNVVTAAGIAAGTE